MDNPDLDKARALRLVLKRRQMAYPPTADYLDGVAKQGSPDPAIKTLGDAQVAAYRAACLAVKAKFPKPT